jgi:phage gpG-like protein
VLHLKITSRHLAQVASALEGIGRRAQDPRVILARFGVQAIRSIQQTFAAGGRPARWKPWALSTAANEAGRLYTTSGRVTASRGRTARARTGKVLYDTGRLANSVTARTSGPRTLVVGTNVVYARIHHLGGTVQIPAITLPRGRAMRWFRPGGQPVFARGTAAHRVRIPARPWLVLQDEDLTLCRQMIAGYVVEGQ